MFSVELTVRRLGPLPDIQEELELPEAHDLRRRRLQQRTQPRVFVVILVLR